MTISEPDAAPAPTFDPDELRRRYREERDKRLRADGNSQYIEIAGEYHHFLDDPYCDPTEQEPLRDEVTAVIIGGGFAGLITGARLRQAGIDDVRIIEKGGGFGGTWYWNRYPGAQCDVEAYVYLPLLEETGYVPTEKYVHAPEILEHCRRIGDHFGLSERAVFSTEVSGLEWEAATSRWVIRTNRGDEMRARYVLMGNGPLHRPKLPGIEGIESFAGHSFHTSRWDYGYTGGDSTGGLTGLAGRRVGIIGTGATAVQVVPHVAAAAGELWVFQRTPSSIDVRANRPTDPAWAASLEPGWHKARMENFTLLTSGGFALEDLVMDGWTDIIGRLMFRLTREQGADLSPAGLASAMEMADFEKMEQIRSRVDEIVGDAETAAALKPWYRQFCKRPCFHDEYLQAYNRPTVHLVDTNGQGVERVTADGVVVGGREYPLDCLIFATGFEVGTDYTRRAGYDVAGRDGRLLSEHWSTGMRSMFGMHVHGFPNLLILGHTQGGFTANYPHLLDEAATQAAHILGHAEATGVTEIEVTAEAEDEWLDTLRSTARDIRAFQESCTPGYYNNEGQPATGGFVLNGYGKGPMPFFQLLAEWRAAGDFAGLQLR
ncbi:MAG TPA: NAD(P)/FAD-dependent oxidoreductase [Acidimicrobiales bacterium]|jgi:cyclohexanone monooxygenase|nr:NAD(P)/FAD-dependent oxidoreductase [Acidimicrobiales bacterium]